MGQIGLILRAAIRRLDPMSDVVELLADVGFQIIDALFDVRAELFDTALAECSP